MIGMESSLRVITHSKLDSISEGLGSLKVLHESKKSMSNVTASVCTVSLYAESGGTPLLKNHKEQENVVGR